MSLLLDAIRDGWQWVRDRRKGRPASERLDPDERRRVSDETRKAIDHARRDDD